MADNSNENQATPVPSPRPDAPLKENPILKQRNLTLEEMEELNPASDTHVIPPKEAERGENVLMPELETVECIQDCIQGGGRLCY